MIATIVKYKAIEAVRALSSQYSKRGKIGILIFIVVMYAAQVPWICLVIPGVAKSGALVSEITFYITTLVLWFFLVLSAVSGTMGGGLGIQEKDATWIFTIANSFQYAIAHTIEYTLFSLVFTAPLMFVPAISLSATGAPLWHMLLFPITLTILVVATDSIASLITIGIGKRKRAVLALTSLFLVIFSALALSPLWRALPTAPIARTLIGSMTGALDPAALLYSFLITIALVLMVAFFSRGYEYEFREKTKKERRYRKKSMKDPMLSKNLLLVTRKKLYLLPLSLSIFYAVIGFFTSENSTFFAVFVALYSSMMLTQQILLHERMWIPKHIGVSGKRAVLSMLWILIPFSLMVLPISALLLYFGGMPMTQLAGVFFMLLMMPPYMIWAALKFKKIGNMFAMFIPFLFLPVVYIPAMYALSLPIIIVAGPAISYLFFRLASKKWESIWDIDFTARFGQTKRA